ncbi:MAG: hypothetical protein M0P26_07895 [Bacteroidales bacterium]|nr:hypothetical protein [Bacteroidales bacterium]
MWSIRAVCLPSAYSVTMNGNKTEYLYDATGMKREARYSYALTQMQIPLGETATENTGSNLLSRSHTDYCGSYIYENDKISRILTPEGYIRTADTIPMNNMGKWKYTYFLKDHLGNTRAQLACDSIGVSGSTAYTVAGTTDYYPFGMETSPSNGQLTSGTNPYLYNGKEMDRMNGLNMYDYGARWRGGEVPSWPTSDPLAEKYPWISPYAYCVNNPLRFVDPDGMDWGEVDDTKDDQTTKEIRWYKNKKEFENSGDKGTYLGEAAVIFNGSESEKLGDDGTLTGKGANAADVTIYGKNGKDDIKTYDGLTMTSNPDEYVPIEEGDYKAYYQNMTRSPYGSKGGSLSYRVSNEDGTLILPTKDGAKNNANEGKPIKTEIFLHRTNNNGDARHSSTGCPNIDGRQWRNVEKQLEKSTNIFIRITR